MSYRAVGLVLILFLTVAAQSAPAQGVACSSWRGEPRPLPSTKDPDPERALFARLRAAELRMRVAGLDETNPRIALQVWTHIVCLDPADAEAVQQVRRLALRVAPELARTLLPPEAPKAPDRQGVARAEARRAAARAAAEAERRAAELAAARERATRENRARDRAAIAQLLLASELARAEALFWEARFAEVGRVLARARLRSDDAVEAEGAAEPAISDSLLARLALLEGRLAAARGEGERAVDCFRRALASSPSIQLDPGSASRKARRLFETARRSELAANAAEPIDG